MTEYAITLKPHWAYAVFHLGKDIENRSWRLPQKYENRRIWIHSSANASKKEYNKYLNFLEDKKINFLPFDDLFFPCSAIVGSVEFNHCPYISARESVWHMEDFNGWKITNPVLLPTPISAKGKLGFWDCTELVKEAV